MSAFDEKLNYLLDEAGKLGLNVNPELFTKVVKGLGPSIYNEDASLVSTSDPDEMSRVKENFIQKKLGVTEDAAIKSAIEEVTAQFGSSNRSKHRAIFYYLLVERFGKASLYND